MRTIKFRGKTKGGIWLYGDVLQIHNEVFIAPSDGDWFDFIPRSKNNVFNLPASKYAVIPDTVGQFTGKIDKNGKEIYEGDILKAKYTKRAPVKYKDMHFCVDYCGFQGLIGSEEYEVVGNVHEDNDIVTYEMCPHCETEVILKAELSVQKCPSCGKYIVCCSMCDECVQDCPFEEEAKRLNDKGGKR